jgi:hypothetical protein
MVAPQSGHAKKPEQESLPHFSLANPVVIAFVLGIIVVIGSTGYTLFKHRSVITQFVVSHFQTNRPHAALKDPPSHPRRSDVRLTREEIDRLLDRLDEAVRQKDIDGVLRHIAHDATITIRLKQGPQQQTAVLTREDYRKTLAMKFAFPSARDFARTTTSVSLTADERSAKVSFKSMETLLQANREFKTEGEETLVVNIRDGKPMIIVLEQAFPGDST